MKNSRKLISIILTLCMVMQILPVFATEGEALAPTPGGGAGGINYLINDDFGAPEGTNYTAGTDGWSLAANEGFTDYAQNIVTTEEIKDAEGNGTGNYALKYSVTADNYTQTHITKPVTRADGSEVAFTEGTDIVIEARMKQFSDVITNEDGTTTFEDKGRSFLKYNMTEGTVNEYNLDFGTLIKNNKGDLDGINGWTKKSETITIDEVEQNVDYYYAQASAKDLATIAPNEWYNVKVVIHGKGAEGNTATYYLLDDEGNVLEEQTGSIDHPGDVKWGLSAAVATPATPATWDEDSLNTLDFRLRDKNTLYLDYVRAYEVKQVSVQANLVDGRYVQFDEDIEVKLTTEADTLTLIESTAALTTAAGAPVAASVSYDAENKILTVNPTEDLIPDTIYNLTFTDNDFIKFTGTKVFELEARAARSKGVVVNDTFDDLTLGITDNASGWYLGTVEDEVGGEISIVNSTTDPAADGATGNVLKVVGDVAHATEDAMQTYLTKKLGGGIEYNSDNKIIIKTKIKHTNSDARVYFLENRPDSLNTADGILGNNIYNLFVVNENPA